jgi:D-glycero-D-manno-heptose 1,7-bisphosphate phosphatase
MDISTTKALFLDRDGVINHDYGYVSKKKDFDFIDGIFELARSATLKSYVICVITNQAGIGRGYYSEEDFQSLTDWMCGQFKKKKSEIAKVYYSPYHPIHGIGHYKKDDYSRKPNPGMFIQAQIELGIDLSKSIFIGDKLTDMSAGIAAGIGKNILLKADDERSFKKNNYICVPSLEHSEIYL